MLDFKPITSEIKDEYQKLSFYHTRSCLHTFTTLFIWGQAEYVFIDGFFVFLAKYGDKYVYSYPVGNGDIKHVIQLIVDDSKERNIPLRLSGLNNDDVETVKTLFPDTFNFINKRDSQDYIYLLEDLKSLKGKKFHSKRNHLSKFSRLYPENSVEEISEDTIQKVWDFAQKWYGEMDDEDILYEKSSLRNALDNYSALGLVGITLSVNGNIIAFTIGSQTNKNTFDVHFEKAEKSFDGAYSAINNCFAKHLAEKYPFITYINREEDMGIEGLRKAKLSYNPVKLQERITAVEAL